MAPRQARILPMGDGRDDLNSATARALGSGCRLKTGTPGPGQATTDNSPHIPEPAGRPRGSSDNALSETDPTSMKESFA
jgi:hypothetical protein